MAMSTETIKAEADDVCELLITADLPGVDEKDVEITVSGHILTIKAQKKVEREEESDEGSYRERVVESRSRSIRLPFDVSDEEIDADFDEGTLTVCVRKPPKAIGMKRSADVEEGVRRIAVKGSSQKDPRAEAKGS